ncbi:MAG: ArsA-related P-loop ATPase [Polyangiaceae bacterium]
MPEPTALSSLVENRRVLITVGAGGVGKTTTAASLAVAAAQRGRRVLCLTIDPAKRLAESLGIGEMSSEAVDIDPARFAAAGVPITGSLTAMMLDTKRTFDELIVKYSSSPAKAKRLLENRLYQYVSTQLAGTQEYMAIEKLIAVKEDPRYDLIVLDTPPTANALDFLDAPGRLVDALDSAATRWFIEAFESSGKFSLNVLARGAAAVLKGIGTITGSAFVESVAEFVRELNDLFGGFRQRAKLVESALRARDVSFILVTSPSPMSLREVSFFSERLVEASMARGAFVVNRFRVPPPFADRGLTPEDAHRGLASKGLVLEEGAEERIVTAHADATHLSRLDAHTLRALDEWTRDGTPVVRIPELSSDVHDLVLLGRLADTLMRGGV